MDQWARWGRGLEPIPETRAAADELGPYGEIDDVLSELVTRGRQVCGLVPECVGLSLAVLQDGVTLTLVSSDLDVALLDAVQYVDGGPCVDAVAGDQVIAFVDEAVSEEQWALFAAASARHGVRSTLTLPILVEGRVRGSINLYASGPHAFDGLHEPVARLFDAWAPGAVTNADLSFRTLDEARRAPRVLADTVQVDVAVGILVAALDSDEEHAREVLRDAAERAGVDQVELARTIVEMHRD